MLHIRREVVPFIGIVAVLSIGIGFFLDATLPAIGFFLLVTAYLLFFFRDPDRIPPQDPVAILSGADGCVLSVTRMTENKYLKTDCVRISVFLSVFDVHVNRAPMPGYAKFLGFFPGKKLAAFREKSSELNQNNKILIEGTQTRCLIVQIVGILARRVVYWLDQEVPVPVTAGDRIGMMKFGSRLDLYLPDSDVRVLVEPGDRVRAGETIVAQIKPRNACQNDFTE